MISSKLVFSSLATEREHVCMYGRLYQRHICVHRGGGRGSDVIWSYPFIFFFWQFCLLKKNPVFQYLIMKPENPHKSPAVFWFSLYRLQPHAGWRRFWSSHKWIYCVSWLFRNACWSTTRSHKAVVLWECGSRIFSSHSDIYDCRNPWLMYARRHWSIAEYSEHCTCHNDDPGYCDDSLVNFYGSCNGSVAVRFWQVWRLLNLISVAAAALHTILINRERPSVWCYTLGTPAPILQSQMISCTYLPKLHKPSPPL